MPTPSATFLNRIAIDGQDGADGAPGADGAKGDTGDTGPAGPNTVTTATTTNITGLLKGDGSNVSAATADTDYTAPATFTAHSTATNNPHSVTATQVGLGNVNNTADADKPISTATQSALDGKQAILTEGAFADGDKTKLDGIEALADVTDAGNVASTIHGATAKTTPVDADTVGLIDSAASNTLKKLSWENIKATLKTYFDTLYLPKLEPYPTTVALSGNGADIASGAKKGMMRVTKAGNITAFVVDCDPANEPSASTVQVDLNKLNRTTGAATTVLSSVATIATGANTGTGTIDGTQAVSVGDLLTFDVDQGSDGKELIATVTITPT